VVPECTSFNLFEETAQQCQQEPTCYTNDVNDRFQLLSKGKLSNSKEDEYIQPDEEDEVAETNEITPCESTSENEAQSTHRIADPIRILKLQLRLPPSAYATMALRELMRMETASSVHTQLSHDLKE
jgi:tRNA(Glu) U13 pseudouridine synthase TruD